MPGEFIEFKDDSLIGYEGEVTVEPYVESPRNWPCPSISRVIQGRVQIPNLSNDPIHLFRSQHIANICRVVNKSFSQSNIVFCAAVLRFKLSALSSTKPWLAVDLGAHASSRNLANSLFNDK